MPNNIVKVYNSVHLYIVDDLGPDWVPETDTRGNTRVNIHEAACQDIRAVFEDHSTATVHGLHFAGKPRKGDWVQFWKTELASKTEHDLVIIYYHGIGGGSNKEYSWYCKGVRLSVYTPLKMVGKTRSDCLFLIDSHFPTRWLKATKEEFARDEGFTEFIASGADPRSTNGRTLSSQDNRHGNFTASLVNRLGDWMANARKNKKLRAPRTLPQIMARDVDGLESNPLRMFLAKTAPKKGEDDPFVCRITLDPVATRDGVRAVADGLGNGNADGAWIVPPGNMTWVANHVKGDLPEGKEGPSDADGPLFLNDEGLADMSSDGESESDML